MRGIALVVVLLLVSCWNNSQQTARGPSTPQTAPGNAPPPPAAISELADAVRRVPIGAADPRHADVVAALAELAEVVRTYSPSIAAQIDQTTAKLKHSAGTDRSHADHVKAALRLALDGFAPAVTAKREPALRAAYVESRRAIAALSAGEALRAQTVELTAALRAITNVASLLAGGAVVFRSIDSADELGYDASQLAERAKRASDAVTALAKERQWKPAGQQAARALHALADVLEVAPLSASAEQRRLLVAAVRYEALEIEREGALTLDRTDRVKAALLACIESFELVRAGYLGGALPLLTAAARTAAIAIDESRNFVFQRDLIQEALRATADAYLVLATTPVSTDASL